DVLRRAAIDRIENNESRSRQHLTSQLPLIDRAARFRLLVRALLELLQQRASLIIEMLPLHLGEELDVCRRIRPRQQRSEVRQIGTIWCVPHVTVLLPLGIRRTKGRSDSNSRGELILRDVSSTALGGGQEDVP